MSLLRKKKKYTTSPIPCSLQLPPTSLPPFMAELLKRAVLNSLPPSLTHCAALLRPLLDKVVSNFHLAKSSGQFPVLILINLSAIFDMVGQPFPFQAFFTWFLGGTTLLIFCPALLAAPSQSPVLDPPPLPDSGMLTPGLSHRLSSASFIPIL